MDRNVEKWFSLSINDQISNIGSEVERALKYKDKDKNKTIEFLNKSIELITRTQKDPKNIHRIGELNFCIEELLDYFIGDNIYNTKDTDIRKYYNQFL